MFSKKFSFENLYNGSLSGARGTQFEKSILDAKTVQDIATILEEAYMKEHAAVQKIWQAYRRKNTVLSVG